MSIKIFHTGNRLATLLIAALMIGCGNSESNLPGASGESDGPAGAPGTSSAVDSSAAGGGAQAETEDHRSIVFIGTSLTAGLGLPEEQSFPRVIERRIDAADLPFRVVNAGISGETSAGALSRIDWLLRQPFEVVVIETGPNDMLRGIEPRSTEQNIQAIIDRIRAENPEASIVLAGMLALPNLGETYGRAFEAIYPRLAERNDVPLIPFLLEGVAGERALNQGDGVHPTAEGHRIVADTVWSALEPVLTLHAERG
jgi:acyl-CoA thioesterase-1